MKNKCYKIDMNIEKFEVAQHAPTIATLINQLDDLNFNRDFCALKQRVQIVQRNQGSWMILNCDERVYFMNFGKQQQ